MKLKMFKNKRGVMDQLSGLGIGIASFAIIIVVTFLVMANVQDQIVSTQGINESVTGEWTTAYNASQTLQSATATIPDWVPLIIIVAIGALILSLVGTLRRRA